MDYRVGPPKKRDSVEWIRHMTQWLGSSGTTALVHGNLIQRRQGDVMVARVVESSGIPVVAGV